MQLAGIHHLTAVTADVARNHAFYTGTLGLRLVKKSVNQDDVSAYHLFYADGIASPGSDITFSTGRCRARGGAPAASCARVFALPGKPACRGGRSVSTASA